MDRQRAGKFVAISFGGAGARGGALRSAAASALPHGRVVRSAEGVVTVLLEADRSELETIAERARVRIAATLGDPELSAGIGGPRSSVAGAHVAMLQAEHALQLGRALGGTGRTTLFADLGPYCFVLGQPPSDIRDFCDRVLGPLARPNGGRHQDLVRTLEVFLRSHGSVNAVARTLFLHRNTVRHRLRRVAELTGANLGNADDRLELQLAIIGRQALIEIGAQ